jgi:hypothetical protein
MVDIIEVTRKLCNLILVQKDNKKEASKSQTQQQEGRPESILNVGSAYLLQQQEEEDASASHPKQRLSVTPWYIYIAVRFLVELARQIVVQ